MHQYLCKRDDIFYFVRRIPADLRQHFQSEHVRLSLRTRRLSVAQKAHCLINEKLETQWLSLRLMHVDSPIKCKTTVTTEQPADDVPDIIEAAEIYLRLKRNDDKVFQRTARRNASYVAEAIGNKPITSYATSEAGKFRDWCLNKGMSIASVRRVFNSVKSIINLTMREHGIEGKNAFTNTFMPAQTEQKASRAIPLDVIREVQQKCRQQDDEIRWIISLLSDTGLRLSEALGLSKDDVHLEHEIPHLEIRQRPWRRLKTANSQRKVPLTGEALWAAERALKASPNNFLFPRYCSADEVQANSASAALNKWLKEVAGNHVIHGFRHSMRDRLRAVSCPVEIIDQIGGWRSAGVGSRYGEGHSLSALQRQLLKL